MSTYDGNMSAYGSNDNVITSYSIHYTKLYEPFPCPESDDIVLTVPTWTGHLSAGAAGLAAGGRGGIAVKGGLGAKSIYVPTWTLPREMPV